MYKCRFLLRLTGLYALAALRRRGYNRNVIGKRRTVQREWSEILSDIKPPHRDLSDMKIVLFNLKKGGSHESA